MECGGIQWEVAMRLRRKYGGREVQPCFVQFVFIFMVETVEVIDNFDGILYKHCVFVPEVVFPFTRLVFCFTKSPAPAEGCTFVRPAVTSPLE
jgi:hypothetical protein